MATGKCNTPSVASAYRDVARAVIWTIASRWGIRIIGVFSTMIMARLLTPEDFGIVAIVALVTGLIDNFSRLGISMLVIREQDTSREFHDTAWTMQILQSIFIAAVLVLLAPAIEAYFSEPRVVPVVYLVALTALTAAPVNIGMVLVRKELDFAKDFRFEIYKRLITLAATIPLAVLWRNYWAIAVGQFIAQLVSVAQSFAMHPYRPRLSLVRAKDYLRFARSVIPYNAAFFLTGKADVFVVGGISNSTGLGMYNVAADLSSTFTREVVGTIGRGLLPNYAKLTASHERLVEVFLTVLGVTAILAMALGLGLAAVASDFVLVLLGEQWEDAAPIVFWLSIYGTIVCVLETLGGHILIVKGMERLSAVLMLCRLGFLIPFIVIASIQGTLNAVAAACACSAAFALPIYCYFLCRSLEIRFRQIYSVLWRPSLSAAAMLAVLSHIPNWFDNAVILLTVKVAMGVFIYAGLLTGLWFIAGRPPGPEQLLCGYMFSKRMKQRAVDNEV